MNYRIDPPEDMVMATITLPQSKSIANRLLIINALSPGAEPFDGMDICDDTRAMANALASLPSSGEVQLNTGAAGTASRFLTAYLATRNGLVANLDGSERMRQRPMALLIESLRSLGADIKCLGEEGFLPVRITGRQLAGGELTIDATVSSQFISALMMIAPMMEKGLVIRLEGEPASRPYIEMTAELMRRAGASIECDFFSGVITVMPTGYTSSPREIECDWSAASYWYEIAALTAGFITLPGLQLPSLQGDSKGAQLFEMLGVVTSPSEEVDNALEVAPSPEQFSRFEVDLADTPDIAQTFAVTSAMLGIPFHLRGLASLPGKETDRLEALRIELDKFGIIAEVRNKSELVWNGERHPVIAIPEIDTYDDHRMAMAFAPTAMLIPGIVIRNAEVVTKSYPGYWDDLRTAGFTVTEITDEVGGSAEDTVSSDNAEI